MEFVCFVCLLANPSSRTMVLKFTQPLTEVPEYLKIFVGGRAGPVRRADNLTAIFEPTV
jgi:hypothetical protein